MLLLPAKIFINTCNPTLIHSFFGSPHRPRKLKCRYSFPRRSNSKELKSNWMETSSQLDLLNQEWFLILRYLSSFLNYETVYTGYKHAWEWSLSWNLRKSCVIEGIQMKVNLKYYCRGKCKESDLSSSQQLKLAIQ